jgi:hypothetical protein
MEVSERIQAVSKFLLESPPGEINDVLNGILPSNVHPHRRVDLISQMFETSSPTTIRCSRALLQLSGNIILPNSSLSMSRALIIRCVPGFPCPVVEHLAAITVNYQ